MINFMYAYDFLGDDLEDGTLDCIKETLLELSDKYSFSYTLTTDNVVDRALQKQYDIFIVAYGALSGIGNSMVEHYTRALRKTVQDIPNKFFVVASRMTQWAVEDGFADLAIENKLPYNLFFYDELTTGPGYSTGLEKAIKHFIGIF